MVFLKGGDGGRGNASYKSSTNRAPRQHGTGWGGEEMWVWLRLKLIADAGLVGLPNAGKSTFLNAVSNANAKVGDYPFTTLHPKLGVVRHKGKDFVLADIPGLIEGAAEGAGVGDRFLGHVERTRILVHLVDANVEDVAAAWRTVRGELDAYGAGLSEKIELIALNKADTVGDELAEALAAELREASGERVFIVSGATGAGRGQSARCDHHGRSSPPTPRPKPQCPIGRPCERADPRDHRRHRLRRQPFHPRRARRGLFRFARSRAAGGPSGGAIEWVEGALDRPESLAALAAGADAIVHIAGLINAPDRAGFEAVNVARHRGR